MEDILVAILQCLWEFVLQALCEIVFELICHVFKRTYNRTSSSFLAATGYTALGMVAGGISLSLAPHAFIHRESLRVLNVFVTPVMVALIMVGIGSIRTHKGKEIIRLDKFKYAYLFALAMALVRFVGAK